MNELKMSEIKKVFFQNSDCDSKTTVHVDAFLYSEEDIDELCDAGKMSRQFCQDCGSHNTAPLSKYPHYIKQSN